MSDATPAWWVRAPWGTTIAVAAALSVYFLPEAAGALIFDRIAINRGEWWRLVTGHWVHFGPSHLLWNLAVLLPAGIWAERLAPSRLRGLLLLAPVVIGAALFWADPRLETYGGLSGLAAAVLAFLAVVQLRAKCPDPWFWRAVLGLLVLKIVAEFLAERPLFARFVSPDLHPVPLAHLAGVACAAALVWPGRRRVAP